MKTKDNKITLITVISTIMALALIFLHAPISAFAAESAPASLSGNNRITFSNIEGIGVNEEVEFEVVDADGNPAVIGIKRMPCMTRANSQSWKVWYSGVTINVHFYMDVTNNTVTRVYDHWIMVIGGTYDDASLSRTSTEGKLTFKVESYAGAMAATCWLKGTTTGTDNEISVSYKM